MTTITAYTPVTLPQGLAKILHGLNFRDKGQMQYEFRRRLRGDIYYVLTDETRVLGWAMTLQRHYDKDNQRMVWYYIRKAVRGKGFGLQLALHVRDREGVLASYTSKFRL